MAQQTMRALTPVYLDPNNRRFSRYVFRDDLPIPSPAEDEILIRVTAVGFFHSLYSELRLSNRPSKLDMPFHVSVGIIEKFGAKADIGTTWSIGDRVGVTRCRLPCSHCSGCRRAEMVKGVFDSRACVDPTPGREKRGEIAEYILAVGYTLVSLPAGLEFDQAALLLGAGTPIWEALGRALVRAQIQPHDVIGIYGNSELAVLAAQIVRGFGNLTITIGLDRDGLDMPCDLILKPHFRMPTINPLLGCQIMEQIGSRGVPKILFCSEALPPVRQRLQWIFQHQEIRLPTTDEFMFHARDDSLQREVHNVLQKPRAGVESMLS